MNYYCLLNNFEKMAAYICGALGVAGAVVIGVDTFINKMLGNSFVLNSKPLGTDAVKLAEAKQHYAKMLEKDIINDKEAQWRQWTAEDAAIRHMRYPTSSTSGKLNNPFRILPFWQSNSGYGVRWYDLDKKLWMTGFARAYDGKLLKYGPVKDNSFYGDMDWNIWDVPTVFQARIIDGKIRGFTYDGFYFTD